MRHVFLRSAIAIALLAAASTGASAQTNAAGPIHVHRESTPPPRAQATDIGARVTVHLRQMEAARAAALFPKGPQVFATNPKTMIPRHVRLIAGLLDECSAGMIAGTDEAEHAAAADAVRQDLARLQELSPGRLEAFLPKHASRVNRLLKFHREALGS